MLRGFPGTTVEGDGNAVTNCEAAILESGASTGRLQSRL
jgi:hypothetical protein